MGYQPASSHEPIACACLLQFKAECPACYGSGFISVAYSPTKTSGEVLTEEVRTKLLAHIVKNFGGRSTGRAKFAKSLEMNDQTVHRALCCGAMGFQTVRSLFQVIEHPPFAMMPHTRPRKVNVLLSEETVRSMLALCDKILTRCPYPEGMPMAHSLKEELLRKITNLTPPAV